MALFMVTGTNINGKWYVVRRDGGNYQVYESWSEFGQEILRRPRNGPHTVPRCKRRRLPTSLTVRDIDEPFVAQIVIGSAVRVEDVFGHVHHVTASKKLQTVLNMFDSNEVDQLMYITDCNF
jgi:hypothetical protein